MADEFENVGASYVAGTEEVSLCVFFFLFVVKAASKSKVYRELAKKAELLRKGNMSEQQVEAAFDEIVGTDFADDGDGFVPEMRDEKIESLFATLSNQARDMEKAAKRTDVQDFDKALDRMTTEQTDDSMSSALSQLDSIKF